MYFVYLQQYFLKDVFKNVSILHAAPYWYHSMHPEIASTVNNWKLTGTGSTDMAQYCVCPTMVHINLSPTLIHLEHHPHIFKEHFIFFLLQEEVTLEIHKIGSILEYIK
jgi:hypothetical protein